MGLAISEEHRSLSNTAAAFLSAHHAREEARALLDAAAPELPSFWKASADMGWLGIPVAERDGGSGFGLPELAVVIEQLGRACAPGPFVPTAIATAVIADLGSPEDRARLLPALVSGATVASYGGGGALRLSAGRVSGYGGVLLGSAMAEQLVLTAGDDVVVVAADAPGVRHEVPANADPTRRSGRVSCSRVEPLATFVGARSRATALARTIIAAECAGAAQECAAMAAGYAGTRCQFGQAIGAFQAVKHHCANMFVAAELATAAAWAAARSATGDQRSFELAAAVACSLAVPALMDNAQLNIQVHGGIGFTWEHDAHLFVRRALVLAALFDPAVAAEDVSRLVAAGVAVERRVDLPAEDDPARRSVRRRVEEIASLDPSSRREALVDAGYFVPHWAPPWGLGADAELQLTIDAELDRAGVERTDMVITGWVIRTVAQWGSPEQTARWVRETLVGRLQWCQLFSEPEAGSDAAAIRCFARRVDGGWRVSGQKIWTSGAQDSQFGLATVRTDSSGPKHRGITVMVIDMSAPGVEIRPLRTVTGSRSFNEVFFDDVHVPDRDVLGPVGEGWSVARTVLANERVTLGARDPGAGGESLTALLDRQPEPAALRASVGRLLARETAQQFLDLRNAERALLGAGPGPEGNVTKLLLAECAQERAALTARMHESDAVFAEGPGAAAGLQLIGSRRLSIAGGTSEITRNQIAERLLGLPRDAVRN